VRRLSIAGGAPPAAEQQGWARCGVPFGNPLGNTALRRIAAGQIWALHRGVLLLLLKVSLCFWLSPSVMTRGTAFSPSYRFTLSDGTVLSAHTKCKLCYPSSPEVQPFIMGIHIIDRYVPVPLLQSRAHVGTMPACDPGIEEPIPSPFQPWLTVLFGDVITESHSGPGWKGPQGS